MNLLDYAVELDGYGISVVPVANDGTKRPARDWKEYQSRRPHRDMLAYWFDPNGTKESPHDGLGVITGQVSGNLEMLETEGRAVHLAGTLFQSLRDHDAHDLAQKLVTGWVESSPSGGMHWFYRVNGEARGNTKLARRRNPDNPRLVDVLIETRGEGGFVVTAPSSGRAHKQGKAWTRVTGGPATVPTLTVEERDMLYALAALLDEMPVIDYTQRGKTIDFVPPFPPDTTRPGDDFNTRANWTDILQGWTRVRKLGNGYTWTRPGKNPRDGISATTGQSTDGVDRLYVFSTSTEFEAERPYTKFGAYALLCHGGDHAAAARQLRREGYGEQRVDPTRMTRAEELPQAVGDIIQLPLPDDAPSLFDRDVAARAYELRVNDAARQLIADEKAGEAPPFDAGTLDEILARPDEPPHRVDGLIPTGASTLIVAMRKTGKTTLTLGLARHLLEGGDFLGRFPVRPLNGRVAVLNYEVSGSQLARWADDLEVPRSRIVLVNLRGRRNPLRHADDRTALAEYLRERQVEAVFVDPFGRAFGGRNQNDAAEVGSWLVDLDQFARAEVGAGEVVLTAHAGWEGERTRGSSALEDWPDVTITMTRGDDKRQRFLAAEGRDILVDEDAIDYDEATRQILMTGDGSRKAAKKAKVVADLAIAVVDIVLDQPGANVREITAKLRETGLPFQNGDIKPAISRATEAGHIRQEHGPRNSTLHYPRMV